MLSPKKVFIKKSILVTNYPTLCKWGVNFYISIKYKAKGCPNFCRDQAPSGRWVHRAAVQFGSPMGGGEEDLARRAGNGH